MSQNHEMGFNLGKCGLTMRAATVLSVKAVAVFFLRKEKESDVERLLVAQHGVEDGEELSHASGERHLLHLAAF